MANKIFEANPHLERVFTTADGEAFYNEPDARLHAKSLKDKTVTRVENPKKVGAAAQSATKDDEVREYAMNAKDTIAAIATAESLEELEAYKDDGRQTVIKALAAKITALNTPKEPATEQEDEADSEQTGSEGADPANGEEKTAE